MMQVQVDALEQQQAQVNDVAASAIQSPPVATSTRRSARRKPLRV
jgi:hypothetical protein